MRITELTIKGYQGINFLDLEIEKPIVLIAGDNATGKTTIRDAIQFAITGESSRVSLKKDYPSLVRLGSDPRKCEVSVTAGGFTFQRGVATGKSKAEVPDFPAVLPLLLGNQRFALLPQKDRAAAIYAITGVKRDRERVAELMSQRRIAPHCIEEAKVALRLGFDKAEQHCKQKCSECRGGWEAVTGERFGTQKAETWQAPASTFEPPQQLQEARDRLVASLPEVEREVAAAQAALDEVRQHTHSSGLVYACPECGSPLRLVSGGDKGPRLETDTAGDAPKPPQQDLAKLSAAAARARAELVGIMEQIAKADVLIEQAKNADRLREEATEKAARLYREYLEWAEAAAALAPTGIPLQLLETAIEPINARLKQTVAATGWRSIVVNAELELSYGGIPYGLCSESEQWRVDAALTEAFSRISGAKLFVLDRMDVLHPSHRGAALNWLVSVAGDHDTILVMATLKQRPSLPHAEIQVVWLNVGGEIEAAA